MDKDDFLDAIVELSCSSGNTGRVLYLVPVLNRNNTAVPVRAYKIPEEAADIVFIVKRNDIHYITVTVRAQNENESGGTQRKVWQFKFQDNRLERLF